MPAVAEAEAAKVWTAAHEARLKKLLWERRLRRARGSLIDYVLSTYPDYDAADHIRKIADALERVERGECDRLIIVCPPRHGKLCADSTPVLTPSGWRTHGSLRPGSRVIHPSGKSIKVVAVSARASANMAVELMNGEVIKCHSNHEWEVFDRASRERRIVETRYLAGVKCWISGRARFQLRPAKAAEFAPADLPMSPYVLGAWLGDGSTGKPVITHAAEDSAVIEHIESLGYAVSARHVHSTTGVVTTAFGGSMGPWGGRMTRELRDIGVRPAKHIPGAYKQASIRQRLELLAGLVDTDGHVDPSGRVRISTVSERLKADIFEVALSLGFRPYVNTAEPVMSSSGIQGKRTVYQVGFQPTMRLPVKLSRKRIRRVAPQRAMGIRSVTECEPEEGKCIEVDSPDGLYCVGRSHVPTHNSTLVSQRFPAWYLGRNPKQEVIHTSYGGDLATNFGRRLRNLMMSKQHREIFPDCTLSQDSQAAHEWHTSQDGTYIAAGVGGAITGRGAHLLLIDDPVKGRAEADSQHMRDLTWEWYLNDAYSRLMKGGRIVIISTRWHEDDLVGRLLAQQTKGGDKWEVLHFPAISNDNEALWPAMYPLEKLERIKRVYSQTDPRAWMALFQGNPTPDDGNYFLKGWLMRGDPPPLAEMKTYGASDYATKDSAGDYTVHMVTGLDVHNRLWVLDLWRKQTESDKWIPPLLGMMQRYKPQWWAEESGQIEKSVGPFLAMLQKERKVYCYRRQLVSSKDKAERARSIQGRTALLGLWIPHAAPWYPELESEMLKFPQGTHDDQVDCLSLIGRMLLAIDKGPGPPDPMVKRAEGEITLDELLRLEADRVQ